MAAGMLRDRRLATARSDFVPLRPAASNAMPLPELVALQVPSTPPPCKSGPSIHLYSLHQFTAQTSTTVSMYSTIEPVILLGEEYYHTRGGFIL